jgi:hypothetical protein
MKTVVFECEHAATGLERVYVKIRIHSSIFYTDTVTYRANSLRISTWLELEKNDMGDGHIGQ